MRAFVVDSSVAAKRLPPLNNEPLASEARVLLTDWTRGKIELSVPDLLLIEVANVLWKAPTESKVQTNGSARRTQDFDQLPSSVDEEATARWNVQTPETHTPHANPHIRYAESPMNGRLPCLGDRATNRSII